MSAPQTAAARSGTIQTASAWVVLAGVAALAAFGVVPARDLALDLPAIIFTLCGLGALAFGIRTRSTVALLVGVPAAWALTSLRWPPSAFGPTVAAVALITAGAYVGLALIWLQPARQKDTLEPVSLGGLSSTPAIDSRPLVAAIVIAAPAVALVFWAPIRQAAAAGFPSSPGRAAVAAGSVALLVSLALATDLARGRPPLRGSGRRAFVLAVFTIGVLTLWFAVRQAAGS